MRLAIKPASNYPLADLVEILHRGFEGYLVPIQFNVSSFQAMIRKDGIDPASSRILLADDQPSGIALIARRAGLRASRVAAMGIARESRGQRAGSWFMEQLIQDARKRNDREILLEVIEQNDPAVRLYRRCGFQVIRRLIGLIREDAKEEMNSDLQEIDLREVGRLISQHGLTDLPWQLSGETIAQMSPSTRAYRNRRAYAVISNPDAEHVTIWSLLVEPPARGNGLGADMLKSLIARYAGRTWHVPAIYPEELGKVFERAGFEREKLSQWQMRLTLIPVPSPEERSESSPLPFALSGAPAKSKPGEG